MQMLPDLQAQEVHVHDLPAGQNQEDHDHGLPTRQREQVRHNAQLQQPSQIMPAGNAPAGSPVMPQAMPMPPAAPRQQHLLYPVPMPGYYKSGDCMQYAVAGAFEQAVQSRWNAVPPGWRDMGTPAGYAAMDRYTVDVNG